MQVERMKEFYLVLIFDIDQFLEIINELQNNIKTKFVKTISGYLKF
jgi:hypothetical protein